MSRPTQTCQVNEDNPWPGLEAFEENARAFFRGRDHEAESLLKRVLDVPVTVLYGRSGLGKTSLLRAGLFPLLRERNLLPIYVRFDVKAGAAPLADQLHQSVCRAISAELPDAMLPGDQESVWEYLHRSDFELWSTRNYPVTPIIVLDQFEELFTLGERVPDLVEKFRNDLGDLAENRIPVDLAARIDKDAALAARYSLRSLNYKLLISLREDFLADLEGWRRLIPALSRSRMRLRPLGADEAFDAVYTPAGTMMTAELAHRVVAIVAGADLHRGYERALPPGARAGEHRDVVEVEPALLSLFCRELNEERKRRGQKQFDTALVEDAKADILSNYYLSCVRDLPGRVADFIESELITEKGFRNSYPREDAVPAHLTEEELTGLIRLRLLRIEDRYGTPRIELTHDVLTGVVREHRDLRRAESEKAALAARAEQERRELAEAAAEREAELEEEKERQQADLAAARKLAAVETRAKEEAQAHAATLAARTRVLRIAVAVAAALAVVAGGLAGLANSNRQKAFRNMVDAAISKLSADTQSASAAQRPGGEYRILQEVLAARALADRGVPADVEEHTEDALFNALVSRGELSRVVWVPGAEVTRFSGDGRHVVAVNNSQCAVRVWELGGAKPLGPTVAPPGSGCRFAWSADGRRIFAQQGDAAEVQLWDGVTGERVGPPIRTDQQRVRAIAVSPDGRRLYTAGKDGTIALWDSETGARIGTTDPTKNAVVSIALSGDQRRLVSADEERKVVMWDAATSTPRPVGEPINAPQPLNVVAPSVDGRLVATGGRKVQLWDVDKGRKVAELNSTDTPFVDTVAISPDGRSVLVGASSGVVQLWNVGANSPPGASTGSPPGASTGSPLGAPISTGDRPVYFAAFDDTGFHFSTTDGALRVRQVDPDRFWSPDPDKSISAAAFSPDGSLMATASVVRPADNIGKTTGPTTMAVRDVGTGEVVGKPVTTDKVVRRLAFSPDGSRLISGAEDGCAQIWNRDSGEQIGVPMCVLSTGGGVGAVAVSPDGGTIVTGHSSGELRLWDAQTQQLRAVLGKHAGVVTGVAFSGDGDGQELRLVSGSWDKTVRVWDVRTRQQVGKSIQGDMPVLSVAISTDGKRVAGGLGQGHDNRDDRGAVRVWDVGSGKPVGEPWAHPAESVRSVAFSSDGDWVVSGAYDGTVRVWSATSGRQLGDPIPTDRRSAAIGVAFSQDGKRILFGTESGAMQTRPGPGPGFDWVREQLCEKLWTNMSRQQWRDWVSPEITYVEVCPNLPVAEDEPLRLDR